MSLKPLPARKITEVLSSLGFNIVRKHGSHVVLKHPDERRILEIARRGLVQDTNDQPMKDPQDILPVDLDNHSKWKILIKNEVDRISRDRLIDRSRGNH